MAKQLSWSRGSLERVGFRFAPKFTTRGYAVNKFTFRLLTLGLRRLKQFLFDIQTPQARHFLFSFERGGDSDAFGAAFRTLMELEMGDGCETPLVRLPPRRIAEADGQETYALDKWFFEDDINPDVCIWDDERLKKWGYDVRQQREAD